MVGHIKDKHVHCARDVGEVCKSRGRKIKGKYKGRGIVWSGDMWRDVHMEKYGANV